MCAILYCFLAVYTYHKLLFAPMGPVWRGVDWIVSAPALDHAGTHSQTWAFIIAGSYMSYPFYREFLYKPVAYETTVTTAYPRIKEI